MSISRKYGRTFHFPFSPGTTSDDRISHNYWDDVSKLKKVVHTEKLDGENTCLSKLGVFARSHAAPTRHPWANFLKERWSWLRHDLGDLEIFGENLYAIHSIEYTQLENHFFVFAIRNGDQWLSWEEVQFYAAAMDFPTVPELDIVAPDQQAAFEQNVLEHIVGPSTFGSVDTYTQAPCSMEGIVSRNAEEYPVSEMPRNVFKYVRKNHVKTNEHWNRNWRRAPLNWEKK
ncbi:MAG: RNA ligase family protein [Bacteroidia bacterium]